jgi:hypothetical protein
MTDAKSATPPSAEPPKTLMQKVNRWGVIVAAIILGLIGILKVYNAFSPQMPDCGSDNATGVIRDIFKKKDIALTALNNFKTVSDESAQRDCTAHIETASEKATISYRISKQGSDFQVLITKVDATP